MVLPLARATSQVALLIVLLTMLAMAPAQDAQRQPSEVAASKLDQPGGIAASKAELLAMTPQWKGERFADGRPKFPDTLLERMKAVKIAHAWGVLRGRGYHNQFDAGWKMLHPDKPFVGRALTAAYLPSRPDLEEHVLRVGKAENRIGRPNSWPIDMLQKGDVYIADGFGKVIDGTLIGDNLATAIFARTGNGVVFDAGARKRDGLLQIEGFNALVRDWDPSEIKGVLLSSINRPIRIGRAIVLPGDIIMAKFEGVLAIPVHVAEEVVITGEVLLIKDEFAHMRLRERRYTPGQIDSAWTDAIKADFFQWYKTRKNNPPISLKEIEKLLDMT
jgi:4-hydroxy-4-methyl-2-oxoglutarate aldolase